MAISKQVTKGQPPGRDDGRRTEEREPEAWDVLIKYLRRPSVLLPLLGLTTLIVLYSGATVFRFCLG